MTNTPAPDNDFYVLGREALLLFLGEMALPPWEEDGVWIGGKIDCAVIASRITEWLDEHDLSDVYLGIERPMDDPTPEPPVGHHGSVHVGAPWFEWGSPS